VTFHDTLPRRGPTQPTIGLMVISGYGGSFALLRLPTTVPSLIISRTFPPGGLWRLPMPTAAVRHRRRNGSIREDGGKQSIACSKP